MRRRPSIWISRAGHAREARGPRTMRRQWDEAAARERQGPRSIPRQHALEHRIAFDEPMVERASDMKGDDRSDHNPADEMPDENPVGERLVLAENGGKVEEAEDADRIAVRIGPRPAEHGHDDEQDIERVLRPERSALLDRSSTGGMVASGAGAP